MIDTIFGRFYSDREKEEQRRQQQLRDESYEKAWAGYKEALPWYIPLNNGDLAIYRDENGFSHVVLVEDKDLNSKVAKPNDPYINVKCLSGATHFYAVDYRDCKRVVTKETIQ